MWFSQDLRVLYAWHHQTKTEIAFIQKLIFADDVIIVANYATTVRSLIVNRDKICNLFKLEINIKSSWSLVRMITLQLFWVKLKSFAISAHQFHRVHHLMMKWVLENSKQTKRAWNKNNLARQKFWATKLIFSLILKHSQPSPDMKINSFHFQYLCKILNIKWQNKVSNVDVFHRSNILLYGEFTKRDLNFASKIPSSLWWRVLKSTWPLANKWFTLNAAEKCPSNGQITTKETATKEQLQTCGWNWADLLLLPVGSFVQYWPLKWW